MIISAVLAAGLITGISDSVCQTSAVPTSTSIDVCPPIFGANGTPILDGDIQVDYLALDAELNNGQITYRFPENLRNRDAWGASFAESKEKLWVFYQGIAYAAANVYQGQRIVQVCIWYTQDGNRVSDTVCSTASSDSGVWLPTDIAAVSTFDTLNWAAPHTIFNIRTSRISPSII